MPCETLGKHVGSVPDTNRSIRAKREIFIIINCRDMASKVDMRFTTTFRLKGILMMMKRFARHFTDDFVEC